MNEFESFPLHPICPKCNSTSTSIRSTNDGFKTQICMNCNKNIAGLEKNDNFKICPVCKSENIANGCKQQKCNNCKVEFYRGHNDTKKQSSNGYHTVSSLYTEKI